MFYTINDIMTNEELQHPLDNTRGNLQVGLKSITYAVGWYNIHERIRIQKLVIEPGLYSFQDLKEMLEENLSLSLTKLSHNGKVKLERDAAIDLGPILNHLFKFPLGPQANVTSSEPIDDLYMPNLKVHLRQLDTLKNFENGKPSDLLKIVRLDHQYEYGDFRTIEYEFPEMIPLWRGMITEFDLSIKDRNNKVIDNHGLPISVVLKISDGMC
jgi:hypothetical protein